MTDSSISHGNVFVSYRAIATVAYQSAISSYGVVGLTAKNIAEGLVQVLVKDPTLGVEVHFNERQIQVDLYIIIEYGTRIKTVASLVQDSVRYQLEKTFGLPVSRVNVHVRGLRISNPD
jgi:uncharacterized alkaline shock family protein YloU